MFARRIRALIIDENSVERLVIREMLTCWDIESDEAASCEQALRTLAQSAIPFNLVFIDAQMPGSSGLECARAIQTNYKTLAMIMLSSRSEAGEATRCCEFGTAVYVAKPVIRWELLSAIDRAIGSGIHSLSNALQGPMSPTPTRSVRVLLVDASEDNQTLMKGYLSETPYEAESAEYGADACGRIQRGNYDLVLMDMQTPVTDGQTVIGEIRNWERQNRRAPIPIIALTTHAQDATKSIEAGCTAHLTKPISKQALFQALDHYQNRQTKPEPLKPSVVEVPQALQALIPRYLEGRRKDIETLRSALEQSDFDMIARVGHNLKGTGAPYGFPEITEIGRSLERAGKESDTAEARRHFARLENYLA
jgi:CheY-like chemotaxis protein